MRERVNPSAVGAGHSFSGDHCIHYGFLRRLHRCVEERIHSGVGKQLRSHDSGVPCRKRVCCRECDDQISGAVFALSPCHTNSKCGSHCEAVQLVWKQWRIRSNHHDYRTHSVLPRVGGCQCRCAARSHTTRPGNCLTWSEISDLATYRNAGNPQLTPPSGIALNENANGVTATLRIQLARRGADPALEAEAHHPRSASDSSFGYRSASRSIEGANRVFRLHVEAVHIVQQTIVGFRNNRQRPRLSSRSTYHPVDDRIADHTDAVCVGDGHRSFEKA